MIGLRFVKLRGFILLNFDSVDNFDYKWLDAFIPDLDTQGGLLRDENDMIK